LSTEFFDKFAEVACLKLTAKLSEIHTTSNPFGH